MKVLVIGLLRLGDFIQTLPVLHGLRTQVPVRQLDVLTFEPVKALRPLVQGVDKWWTLNRDDLQHGLGRADVPMLASFSILKEQLDTIDAQKYDAIINLTQTRFSAWIAGYLHTANRTGLALDVKGKPHFHSPWFQYLDDFAEARGKDIFHYTDIFFYGCGLKGGERHWWMRETTAGQIEFNSLEIDSADENIVLQLFTSDAKKTWTEDQWLEAMTQLQLLRPKAKFVLLGSPHEETRINSIFARTQVKKLRSQKAILSLEGAFSLLKNSDLLISGDTSIKHMANCAKVPILELSMGSSDYRRTGAYTPNSLILQADVTCGPCPHSMPCSQATHACAMSIAPSAVAASAHHLLACDWGSLKNLADEFAGEVRFLRTHILDSGFWYAADLIPGKSEEVVETILERCTWKFVNNREFLKPVAQFGSEGIYMQRELATILPSELMPKVNIHLDFLEQTVTEQTEKVARLWEKARQTQLPQEPVIEIGNLRRMHNQLERVYQQTNVKLKLIRSLKSQLAGAK